MADGDIMNFKTILSICAMGLLLSACNSDAVPEGKVDVKKFVTKLRGYHVPNGIVMTQTEQPVWIQHLTTGYSSSANGKEPSEVAVFDTEAESCTVPAPESDDQVGHVFFTKAHQASALHAYTEEDLRKSVMTYVKWKKSSQQQANRYTKPVRPLDVIDVFVTETAKPVYLVLTSPSKVVWNVHPAAGVTIKRIVLIGHETVAVATAELNTPVNILRCAPPLVRDPQPHWGFVRNEKERGIGTELLGKNRAQHRKFSFWFKQNFSVWSDHNLAVANKANHALIGPVPTDLEARVEYKSVADRKVRITDHEDLVISTKDAFKKLYFEQVKQLADEIGGASLASVQTNE